VVGRRLEPLSAVVEQRMRRKFYSVLENNKHPFHSILAGQRSSCRERLISLRCRTERFRKSFVVFNSDCWYVFPKFMYSIIIIIIYNHNHCKHFFFFFSYLTNLNFHNLGMNKVFFYSILFDKTDVCHMIANHYLKYTHITYLPNTCLLFNSYRIWYIPYFWKSTLYMSFEEKCYKLDCLMREIYGAISGSCAPHHCSPFTEGDAQSAQRSVPQENGDTGGSSVPSDMASRSVLFIYPSHARTPSSTLCDQDFITLQ